MSSGKYVCTLSAEMLEKAKKELNEDPNTRHIEIKTLRERLEKVPGYKGRLDDGFLLRFLRAKKFDQERAFKQVITFYQMKKDNPEVFENLTPQRVRHVLEAGVIGVLKDRAPDGSRIFIFRPGCWDPDKGPITDIMATNFLTMSKLIEEEETQVCGFTMINDMKDIGWHQAKHVSPMYARRVSSMLQEAFPARIKKMNILNEPTFFDVIFAILKQFMKEKILKRIQIHGPKFDKLHESIPKDILPEDFEGSLPKYSNADWCEKLLACEGQFVEENKYGLLDMTIPAKQQKKADATESLGGTFRKLNVD
ncbi:alpha-tocopherol transfer protein-like [Littorina saxatilis]|uniref:CRAL-TRIO domain-containing protein n=1 Tax=Littorina saxatilis TaxID=31220 RepID=A0AAN9G1K1_9CAEN